MGKSVSAYFLAAIVLGLGQHPEAFGSQGKSDFRNAAVFRDKANKIHPLNGQVDDDEDVQTTDADGRFKLPRGRGGRLLLTGGIDIRTGLANGFSVVASPASVRNIGTLTALWQALLDRKVKAASAKKRLGFTKKVTISQYQAGLVLDSTAGNKPVAKLARQQGYLLQLIRALATRTEVTSHQPLTLSPAVTVLPGEDPVISVRASLLANTAASENLTDPASLGVVINAILDGLGIAASNDEVAALVNVIVLLNGQAQALPPQFDRLDTIVGNAADLLLRGRTTDLQGLATFFGTGEALAKQLKGDVYPTYPRTLATLPVASTGTLNVNDFSLTGTMPVGSVAQLDHVNVYLDGQLQTAQSVVNYQMGTWSCPLTKVANGKHILSARAARQNGSEGAVSDGLVITVAGSGTADNHPPAGTVTISGIPIQKQQLLADPTGISDADGLGGLYFQWKADGAPIDGATGDSLMLGKAEVGKQISVAVSYTDGNGFKESLESLETAKVANINDAPTGNVVITGAAQQGETLIADTHNLVDGDGLGAFSYQWLAAGAAIGGAGGVSYQLTAAEVGKHITVTVSYVDGNKTPESVTSEPTSAVTAATNHPPAGTVTILGDPIQKAVLSANSGNLDDADGLGPFSYQWAANGISIPGATGNSYTLTETEVGRTLTVTISYTDGQGNAESVLSSPTAIIANVNDAPAGNVTIGGTPQVGQVLTVDTRNLTDADGLGTFSYQWQAGGIEIGVATANSYLISAAELGKAIAVTVSYADGHGTPESKTSAATVPVTNPTQSCEIVVPAEFSGGCTLYLVGPENCGTVDITAKGFVELDWSTHQTFCEGPHTVYIAGSPVNTWLPSGNNVISYSISSNCQNNCSMVRNMGGYVLLTKEDLAGLTTVNGQYYFMVKGFYGSHSEVHTFFLK